MRRACVFYSIPLPKGSLKCVCVCVCFFSAMNFSAWCQRIRQAFCSLPAAPAPPQDVRFGLCLVMDSAGENFQNNSMCILLTLAPPCGLGEESQESGFLAEDVGSAWACVWGEMGCQALGVLWNSLPRHCDYLHILKKNKIKRLKGMAFLFTALVCTFF